MLAFLFLVTITSCDGDALMDTRRDIKPGHQIVKEFHFHPYWAQHNEEQEAEALVLRDKIVLEVMAGNMTVVCNGVNSEILPGLDDTRVPHFNTEPIGPHPVGSFEVWTMETQGDPV